MAQLILYVGRLEQYKNIQRVIEAVAYLPQGLRFTSSAKVHTGIIWKRRFATAVSRTA